MINNAEQAISAAASKAGIEITDYTAAPQFMSVDKTVGSIIKGSAESAGNGSSAVGAPNSNNTASAGNGNSAAGAPADTENGTAGTFAQGNAPAARSALVQGYHVWAIEFSDPLRNPESPDFNPRAVEDFAELLDAEIQKVNSDYEAKRSPGSTMQRLKILPLAPGTFYRWMESRGKTGGQNKVPRLWKDLKYIDQLRNMSGPQ
ncbi:MAG: GH3 auxin-responsive promoter family protein [Bacteroidales bacterium]|nr:GH3 auxin-responsive promoter family protein [Bacteroidales bacterium]